jgi:hypothetical protein
MSQDLIARLRDRGKYGMNAHGADMRLHMEAASRIEELEAQLAAPVAQTPAANWRVDGEPDPHGGHYDCERAALCMGGLTDDELANAAYMNYDRNPSMQEMMEGRAFRPIVYMTAVKERIRWLSRALEKAKAARQGEGS